MEMGYIIDCKFYFMWIPCDSILSNYPECKKISKQDMKKLFKNYVNLSVVKSFCIF